MMWPVYVEKLETQATNNWIYLWSFEHLESLLSAQAFEMVKLQKEPAKLFALKWKFSKSVPCSSKEFICFWKLPYHSYFGSLIILAISMCRFRAMLYEMHQLLWEGHVLYCFEDLSWSRDTFHLYFVHRPRRSGKIFDCSNDLL